MCGIGGIWRRDGGAVSHRRLRQMMSAIRHRGPEGSAHARLDGGALELGFLALGFTDAPTSLQPLFNEDGSIALVYNGEIYDYVALRRALVSQGHVFRTRSDSEVLIHLYEQHGTRFVEQLNGELAFALWDARDGTLSLYRDRFGVKPLFYAWHQGAFVFASEAKAILALDGFARRIEPRYFCGPGVGLADCAVTPFAGIRAVRPGHRLRIGRSGEPTEEAYWTARFERRADLDHARAAEAVHAELRRAVERRVAGDVPIALALSGGVDSAVVAALSAGPRPDLKAFCVAYPGKPYDESVAAARSAAHVGLAFEAVECSAASLGERFMESIWAIEHVTNSLSPAARVALGAAAARSGAKALIGGEGSDELFGGYPYFGLEALWRLQRSSGRADRRRGDRLYHAFRQTHAASRGVFWDDTAAWRRTPALLGYPSVYHLRALRTRRAMRLLLSRPLLDAVGPATPLDTLRGELSPSHLQRLDPFDATRVIARHLLSTFALPALGDRVEMVNALEGRAPYLDLHVVTLAHALAEHHCLTPDGLEGKQVLRRAFADALPAGFRSRPKHTFLAPTFAELAASEVGRELIETLLCPRSVRAAGLLDPRCVAWLRRAWSHWPRASPRLDALIGYCLGVQALHRVFIEAPGLFGHRGPLLRLATRPPPGEAPVALASPER